MALSPTFQSILYQARTREPEAISYLCLTYHPAISRYVSRHVPFQAAEDITQDIFLRMVTDIHMLRANNEAEFRAWLFAITYTAIAAYHRQTEKIRVVPLETASNLSSPDDPTQPLLEAERITAVTGAISMLTTKHRKIVIGRAHNVPYKTIALHTGMKETTVRSAHHRALLWMRDKLAVQIVVIIVVCSIMIGAFLYKASVAQPGDSLYPVKQMLSGSPEDKPSPRHRPVAMPTIAPTPTVQPTASPTPTPTTIKATPTTGPSRDVLDAVATALPLQDQKPVACVLGTCLKSPLP
jgi:RNA polymerase sigma factor (sigma-70 family)